MRTRVLAVGLGLGRNRNTFFRLPYEIDFYSFAEPALARMEMEDDRSEIGLVLSNYAFSGQMPGANYAAQEMVQRKYRRSINDGHDDSCHNSCNEGNIGGNNSSKISREATLVVNRGVDACLEELVGRGVRSRMPGGGVAGCEVVGDEVLRGGEQDRVSKSRVSRMGSGNEWACEERSGLAFLMKLEAVGYRGPSLIVSTAASMKLYEKARTFGAVGCIEMPVPECFAVVCKELILSGRKSVENGTGRESIRSETLECHVASSDLYGDLRGGGYFKICR